MEEGVERRADYMEKADMIGLGISYDMLVNAVIEAGGTLDVDGCYPMDDAISTTLRKLMKCQGLLYLLPTPSESLFSTGSICETSYVLDSW